MKPGELEHTHDGKQKTWVVTVGPKNLEVNVTCRVYDGRFWRASIPDRYGSEQSFFGVGKNELDSIISCESAARNLAARIFGVSQ